MTHVIVQPRGSEKEEEKFSWGGVKTTNDGIVRLGEPDAVFFCVTSEFSDIFGLNEDGE